MSNAALDGFIESLQVIREHYGWSYEELGDAAGRSRQWAYNLVEKRRGGSTLDSLDKMCAALARQSPSMTVAPGDLLDPDKVRLMLGVTPAVTPTTNRETLTALTRESTGSSHGASTASLADHVGRLEREHIAIAAVFLDFQTGIEKFFADYTSAGRSGAVESLADPLRKAAGSSGGHKKIGKGPRKGR